MRDISPCCFCPQNIRSIKGRKTPMSSLMDHRWMPRIHFLSLFSDLYSFIFLGFLLNIFSNKNHKWRMLETFHTHLLDLPRNNGQRLKLLIAGDSEGQNRIHGVWGLLRPCNSSLQPLLLLLLLTHVYDLLLLLLLPEHAPTLELPSTLNPRFSVRMGPASQIQIRCGAASVRLLLMLSFLLFRLNEALLLQRPKMDNFSTPEPDPSPQPFIPLLAPSPLPPFTNISYPKLSGSCALNFSSVSNIMTTTALDCSAAFAPFLANVICCPQLQATLLILLGEFSKNTGFLALDTIHANHCVSDIQKILGSQGANADLPSVCSIQPLNLTSSSCPVRNVDGFESVVGSSEILEACKNVDSVNECCSQLCQTAILEASQKLAWSDGVLPNMKNDGLLRDQVPSSSRVEDCRNVVLRWLASRLDPLSAKQMFRQISNCNINKVCPLVFSNPQKLTKYCGNEIKNRTVCCHSMTKYVSHLQKQSFITNFQALNCAALLGRKLQKINITKNVYSLCQITLKHFSVQVGTQESGCLLPSLPSDVTFDQSAGISFTCDLNDNIAAPWPSSSETPSSCNKTKVNMPALPAATSAEIGIYSYNKKMLLRLVFLLPIVITVLS